MNPTTSITPKKASFLHNQPQQQHSQQAKQQPPPNHFRTDEKTHKNTHFCTTAGSLSSYLIIEKFEDQENVHCPEMTFFQNTFTITHLDQQLSLVFTASDAILGTVTPNAEDYKVTQSELNPEVQQNEAAVVEQSKCIEINGGSVVYLNPHFDLAKYLPNTTAKCKSSDLWQHQQNRAVHRGVEVDGSPTSHFNNWMFGSIYQGDLISNVDNYFLDVNNTQPGTLPIVNHQPLPLLSNHNINKTSQQQQPQLSAQQSPFVHHIQSLVSPALSLTQQTSSASIPQENIPTPQLAQSVYNNTYCRQIKLPKHYNNPTTTQNDKSETNDKTTTSIIQVESFPWEISSTPLDYKMLTNTNDQIVYYNHVVLYEDELHDNGISRYTIRTRAMTSCYYVLVRNFTRIDDVSVTIRDTRYMYVYNNDKKEGEPDYLYRETRVHHATFEELKALKKPIESKDYTEDFAAKMVPVCFFITEKIDLNKLVSKKESI